MHSDSFPNLLPHFLRLQNPIPRILFLVSSPYLEGASVLLCFWILRNNQIFSRVQASCSQRDLKFDKNKYGIVFSVNHRVSVKLIGTIKLTKCAVIDCFVPVFSISVSFGFLILGEDNGVSFFWLTPIIKRRVKKHGELNLPNGKIQATSGDNSYSNYSSIKIMKAEKNVHLEEKIDKHSDSVNNDVQISAKQAAGSSFTDSQIPEAVGKQSDQLGSMITAFQVKRLVVASGLLILSLKSAQTIRTYERCLIAVSG